MKKPIVRIKNAELVNVGDTYRLQGNVVDHPRFLEGTFVSTSKIVVVETNNTKYVLED